MRSGCRCGGRQIAQEFRFRRDRCFKLLAYEAHLIPAEPAEERKCEASVGSVLGNREIPAGSVRLSF